MNGNIERVTTQDAPSPAGHYAQATAWRDIAFVSGQLPLRPDGTHMADQPFEDQARQVLANLFAVLKASDSGPEFVLRVTAYIVGVRNWPRFNEIYAAAFGDVRPARTVVPVPELHHGCLIEVEAIDVRASDAV